MFGSDWPIRRLGMPHANSTISMPRWIEARDSASVLPCSRVMSRASLSASATSFSRNRNSTRARSTAGVLAQAGKACAAATTARSTSAAVPSGTRPISRPVEGLNTSPKRSDRLASQWPPTSIGTSSCRLPDRHAAPPTTSPRSRCIRLTARKHLTTASWNRGTAAFKSASLAGRGESLVTRCCTIVPATSASTSSGQ